MISQTQMLILLGAYIIVSITSLFEQNWPRALYFFSAGLITISVLLMGAK